MKASSYFSQQSPPKQTQYLNDQNNFHKSFALLNQLSTRRNGSWTRFKEVYLSGGAFLSDSSPFLAFSTTVGNKSTRRHPCCRVMWFQFQLLWLQAVSWDVKTPLIQHYTRIIIRLRSYETLLWCWKGHAPGFNKNWTDSEEMHCYSLYIRLWIDLCQKKRLILVLEYRIWLWMLDA